MTEMAELCGVGAFIAGLIACAVLVF